MSELTLWRRLVSTSHCWHQPAFLCEYVDSQMDLKDLGTKSTILQILRIP